MRKSRKTEWTATLAALLSGVAAHAFALVNIVHNYDNILQQPTGYGAGITSGRWLLSAWGDFCTRVLDLGFNLPVINGLGYLILIALSAGLVVNLLQIRKPVSAALTGCLMATFPTVCSTMVFRYTAPYYGLSLLLSVLAVWAVDKKKYGVLLSGCFLALSMGLYQAYPPATISLFVLILMRDSLSEGETIPSLIRRGIKYCVALIWGVILYFLLLKVFLALYSLDGEVALDPYQGIDTMGKLSLSELPYLIRKAWVSAALFPIRDYCNLASTKILKLLWSVLVLMILLLAVWILISRKPKILNGIFFCLMGIVFPLAVNFVVIMCPEGIIYTIMVYSFVLIGCAPLMLMECLPKHRHRENNAFAGIIGVLLAGIVFYNSYYANYNYTSLHYANRQTENYISGLMTQMRMTEGYTPEKKWVFLGTIQDPQLYDIWNVADVYGGVVGSSAKGLLNATYSFDFWIHSYIGIGTNYASQTEKEEVGKWEQVTQMPCWPSEGSIQVVDEYIVVKFQEVAQ